MTSFAGTELQRGTELAGYRIEALLGRGGMGVVYLAEQLRLKRRVALKLLAPELAADQRFRERFLRESELAASLDHPNVVPIYDAGETDGLLYIAMRYVEGTDLGTLLASEGRLEPDRALAIIAAVASALDAAHARGLVHRDVKPANVLLAHDGHVYLADFGLTRSAQEGSPEEKPHLSGTLEYVAPEQIEGHPPDPAADIYALGCVLYHSLAGQPPFAKRTQMELLWAHFNEDAPSLHQVRPELPEAIDAVIAKSLAKEPAERYPNGRELASAASVALGLRWMAKARDWDDQRRDRSLLLRGSELRAAEAYLAEVGEGAEPVLVALQRDFVTASRAAVNRRQRLLLTASLTVAAIAIVSLAFALISRSNARSEAKRADAAATQAKAAETAQLAQRLGAQALVEDDLDRSLLLARQAVAIDDSLQTRGDLLAALQRNPAAIGVMKACCQEFGAAALSSDGRYLAAATLAGATAVDLFDALSFSRVGGEPWVQLPENAQGLAFSPDGHTLAALGATGGPGLGEAYLVLLDARTREVRAAVHFAAAAATDSAHRGVGRVEYSPDGKLLATAEEQWQPGSGAGDWLLALRDPRTGKPSGPPLDTGAGRMTFAFTPDGRSLLTSNEGASAALVQWDLETRQAKRTFPGAGGTIALSPDGLTAAIGRPDGTVALLDLVSGRERAMVGGHDAAVSSTAFSPDGNTLATTSEDGTAIVWDVTSRRKRETLRGHTAFVTTALFSPDGDTLYTVSHDGIAIAWDLAGDRRLGRGFRFTETPNTVLRPGRFSPDGRLIVVGLEGGGIGLRDAADLDPVEPDLRSTGGDVSSLSFSQDGKTLAAITWDGKATIWDLQTGSLLRGPWVVSKQYGYGPISPDGKTLAACGQDGVTLWDLETGARVGRLGDPDAVSDCALDPAGEIFAIAGNADVAGGVEIWDVAARTKITTVDADRWGTFTVGFSPVDDTLATAGWESMVRIWNARTGKLIRTIDARGSGVGGVVQTVFSPDGRTLAVGGTKGNLTLWDVGTGAQIGTLDGSIAGRPGAAVWMTTDFSPDGKHLLMTLGDGRAIVWDIDPESWKRRACEIAGRALTQQEWDEFLPGRPYKPACRKS